MKFLKICAKTLVVVIVLAVAGFFLDRQFVRYYKTEIVPAEVAAALKCTKAILDGNFPAALKCADFGGNEAQNLSSAKKLRSALLKRGVSANDEIKIYPALAWVKNKNLGEVSQRVFDKKIFVYFIPADITEAEAQAVRPAISFDVFGERPATPAIVGCGRE